MIQKIVQYDTVYLSNEIVLNCFEKNKHNFVDKVVCGNGFTTSFLQIEPTQKYQSNIIIVPNRQVVISKKISYDEDVNAHKVKIGFIYGDDDADKVNFAKFDVMMFVVDSFLNYIDVLIKNRDLIDKIMVDEAHSFPIQSTYRNRLVSFQKYITETFTDKSIVSVTATPMLFQKVDIKIVPKEIENRTIYISQNQENTLTRIQDALLRKENVIVALQDARILKRLADSKNILKANVKVGTTMFQKILENVVLNYDSDSNLTIISSAGFEGFDVVNGLNNIFILEDRNFDYQTFYTQNISQIIGRSRKGTVYIEWCRMSNANRTALKTKEEMTKQANSKKVSFEKKMTDKNYAFIPKYFDVDYDIDFGLITDLKLNDEKYDLHNELSDADLKGMRIYTKFFNDRGFDLKYLDDGTKRLNLKTPSHQKAFDTVKLNRGVLKQFDLFSDIRLDLYPKVNRKSEKSDNTKDYIREIELFLRRKYWDAEKLPFKMKDFEYLHLSKDICNEMRCYNHLTNPKELKERVSFIIKERTSAKQESICRKSREYKIWKSDLEKNTLDRYIRLNMAFCQSEFKIPNKIRNSRNYNLLTEVSMPLIEAVGYEYNTIATEIDIVSCNPRVIYAFCGLDLPSDFYGIDKVNKKAINKLINTLSKHQDYKNEPISYKKNKIKALRKFGFHEDVITFLITEFWDKPKDSLFNFCAYHEKEIINKLTAKLINISEDTDYKIRYVRRHDSVIIFGGMTPSDKQELPQAIADFKYLGLRTWFNGFGIQKSTAEWKLIDEKELADMVDNDFMMF